MDRNDNSCGERYRRMDCAGLIKSTLEVVEGKWKIIILNELMSSANGPLRFSELEKLIDGVAQKVLSQQLKQLEKDGIVLRTVYPQVPPKVEYSLTELGRSLVPVMKALIDWAETRANSHAPVSTQPNALDTGVAQFGAQRS